ncbi:MAG: hypothetical protein KAJ03_00670, partial [Gammaproteobacteria bacterium]|nr:hypothetical protein [Gammaproteobacteria bacterium]
DGEWGYKPLSEAEHPYYYTCPLSYLKLAPPTSPEWREMVRAHHEDVNARRRKRSPAKVSSITEWRTG